MNEYDKVPYPNHPHPQAHPDRLATIASLFGMTPGPLHQCRVLELACGNGSNIIPVAWAFPESEFVGIDLAASAIAAGQEMIRELKLGNISLRQGNLMELTPGWQEFDYIIVHGLYSWIPAPVREHLLAVCRGCLAPAGVAFISYNAYPGSHLREMLREMMLFHVHGLKSSHEQVEQAKALVKFLVDAQQGRDEYRRWVQAELDEILKHDEGHLYHDELAECNQPFYFIQFISQAGHHHLQYLGEADYFEMSDHAFPAPVRERLEHLAPSRILKEQYLDFLKCRRFRQTLLCRAEATVRENPRVEAVRQFIVSSSVTCRSSKVDLRPGVPMTFEAARGAKAETDFAAGKAALMALSDAGPTGMPFRTLADVVEKRLQDEAVTLDFESSTDETLGPFLLQLYGAGVVGFRTAAIRCLSTPSQIPVASPIARWQIRRGNLVTSLFHHAIQVEDEIGRQLLLLLDGTRNREAIAESLCAALSPEQRQGLGLSVEQDLDKNLMRLARFGLLVA